MKILNKFLNKKISLAVTLAALFVVAALVYSLGYRMAMNKFNTIVGYTQEKQKMYSKISEVDYNIRNDYIGKIDEDKLYDGTCAGYLKGLNDSNCKYLSAADYKSYKNEQENLSGDVTGSVIGENTAVLSCPCMGRGVSSNFISKLEELVSNGVNRVVIDLRNTSKGSEQEVFSVLEYMAGDGDIVQTVDLEGNKEVVCAGRRSELPVKFVVLINDKTSGLAEVFASALRDTRKIKLVGVETAGNAVRTKVVNLSDDSVIVFPDAFYVTKSGAKFFKNGIKPDVNVVNKSGDDDLQMKEATTLLSNETA